MTLPTLEGRPQVIENFDEFEDARRAGLSFSDWINSWAGQIAEKGRRYAMLNRLWILTWADAQWELWDRESAADL